MTFDWSRLYTRCKDIAGAHSIPVLSQQEVRFGRDLLHDMITDVCDTLLIVAGDRGAGKSLGAGRLSQIFGVIWTAIGYWNDPYERYRLIFDSRDMARMARDYTSLRMGDVNLIEEPQTSELSNKRQLTLEGQLAASFIRASRERQLINIVTTTDDEILNEVFQKHKTQIIFPPFGRAKQYHKRGYISGRGRNIHRKKRETVWVVKFCEYSPSLGHSISLYRKIRNQRTRKIERKMFLYLRHPGDVWNDEYERVKPIELEKVFRQKFEKLDWAEDEPMMATG